MTPSSFAAVVKAMRPSVNRIQAEIDVIHQMKQCRTYGMDESSEGLLSASGALYTTFAAYCLENGLTDAYEALQRAWIDVAIDYDRGAKGEEFAETAFGLYRLIVDHRLSVD